MLVIMAQHNRFIEALWTAYSWVANHQNFPTNLRIYIDGEVTVQMKEQLRALLPGAEVADSWTVIENFSGFSKEEIVFFRNDRYGRKLGLLLALNHDHDFIFSDNDIVFFNQALEICEAIQNGRVCYNEEMTASYCPAVVDFFAASGRNIPLGINSGLLSLPKHTLSLSDFSAILPSIRNVEHFYIEQAFIAGCCSSHDPIALPTSRYVTSWNGMWFWQKDREKYHKLVCRHFFGVVRHLMYLRGYPEFLKMVKEKSNLH